MVWNRLPRWANYYRIYTRIDGAMFMDFGYVMFKLHMQGRIGICERLEAWEIGQILGGN